MPIYDYKCDKCGETFSLVMSVKEKETKKIKCGKCRSTRVKPVYTGFFAVTSKKS
ncbi:MAG TPA: FmdB family zinc ribbon protein [Dissulfurispiraceae bacterium]|nr:FmdB family zinc ribbon protein [Dissulfurispiraceae bacterium]